MVTRLPTGGDLARTLRELVNALRLRPLTTYAHPHWAVQARLELIRVQRGRSDVPGAKKLMDEIDEILAHRPDLGALVEEVDATRAQLAKDRGRSVGGALALTAAELRLLPLLSTYPSVPEIAPEAVLVAAHHQGPGEVDLPQAGCVQPKRVCDPRASSGSWRVER